MSGCLSKPLTSFFCLETYLYFLICSMDKKWCDRSFLKKNHWHNFFLFHYIYPFLSISWKMFSLFLIRHWINENKTGKYNVCKGKLSFLGDIVSKLSCRQFFLGRKSTFLELIFIDTIFFYSTLKSNFVGFHQCQLQAILPKKGSHFEKKDFLKKIYVLDIPKYSFIIHFF
jgi:hypothetical protein